MVLIMNILAHVAQLAEHFLGKGEVIGSNPIAGSRKMVTVIVLDRLQNIWQRTELQLIFLVGVVKSVIILKWRLKKGRWDRYN